MRHLQLEDHDSDDDCEDTIAECRKPLLRQFITSILRPWPILRFHPAPGRAVSVTSRLRILPRLSISVSMRSPGLRNVLVPWPTPPQVPQLKTSPGSSERIPEAYSICSSGVKMNCDVLPFCFTSPLTVRRMNRFMWSGTNTRGTRNGPIGAKLSWL